MVLVFYLSIYIDRHINNFTELSVVCVLDNTPSSLWPCAINYLTIYSIQAFIKIILVPLSHRKITWIYPRN